MDLNQKVVLCPHDVELRKNINFGDTDTTLCLNGLPFGETNTTSYSSAKNNLGLKFPNANDDGCRLVLGLGPLPRAYDNDFSNFGSKKRKEKTIVFAQHVPSDCDSILQLGLSGGTNETSSVLDFSGLSENDAHMSCLSNQTSTENSYPMIPVVDEGSTSAKKSSGYMASLLVPRTIILQTQEPSNATSYSHGSSSSENRTSNLKRCNFVGCTKGARGASGFCIGHGGGQRCQKPGCNKGAESRTAYCKAHGGGRRCEQLGCTKSAEGKTDYCIAHGGGKRCGYPGGCTRAARGKSGLCIRHGGGKRCKIEGCNRSAEGQAGLCISHGGGRRCQHQGCTKGAQGSTMFCKAHGGGKRCSFAGCTKGAEGSTPLCKAHGGGKRCLFNGGGICPKSVHGGTNFCVAHGGGKRCAVPDCTKSARGRTDCCVKHGGGKRCKFEYCGKSAQGSTDLCKAHGGGKRCVWGEEKCEKFARGKSGLCAAHSSFMMQERETNKASLIAPRLFHGVVSTASNIAHSSSENKNNDAKLQHLIPKEVLVPLSMKSFSSSCPTLLSVKKDINNFNLPEGRVHGGDLMLYLGGSFNNAANAIWSAN